MNALKSTSTGFQSFVGATTAATCQLLPLSVLTSTCASPDASVRCYWKSRMTARPAGIARRSMGVVQVSCSAFAAPVMLQPRPEPPAAFCGLSDQPVLACQSGAPLSILAVTGRLPAAGAGLSAV